MFAMATYNACMNMLIVILTHKINVTNCLDVILSSDSIMTSP